MLNGVNYSIISQSKKINYKNRFCAYMNYHQFLLMVIRNKFFMIFVGACNLFATELEGCRVLVGPTC